MIQAGDLVLFPRDRPHAVSGDRRPPDQKKFDAPLECEIGEAFTSALCGYYLFESSAARALLDALPDVVLLLDARNNSATAGVGQIAEQCGYRSDISFRKAFKKVTGLTPKQVRSQNRGTLLEQAARLLPGPWSMRSGS